MSDVKRLIDQATPLPWTAQEDGVFGPDGDELAEVHTNFALGPFDPFDNASALDIACPICDATYTVYEEHDCAPLRRFRVVMEDDDGGRHNVIVPAAPGIHDAKNQARERFPYESPVQVEEVLPDRGRMTDEPTYREAS